MSVRFGTDGIRGRVGDELTPELADAIGRAAARALGTESAFRIARDTRESGPLLEAALVDGLTAEGADVELLGVLPTPGLAHVCRLATAPGVMISASHNPYEDNGIKLFAAGGRKLHDEAEAAVEAELHRITTDAARVDGAAAVRRGVVHEDRDAFEQYVDHLTSAVDPDALAGLRIVVDCGNGAACEAAPAALRRLGAEVDVLHDEPDGRNINASCGSTDPSDLRKEVLAAGAHAGLALDGDADRVIAVDEAGELVDGDHVLAILALDRLARGTLTHDIVVTTVMANLGLIRALEQRGIEVIQTPVGDRHVLEAMERTGAVLGGEQSGHVIVGDLSVTGDGPLTGILVLDAMARSGETLAELAEVVQKLPQELRNVRVARRDGLDSADGFWREVRAVEAELGDAGRVLVRPSGTEPVIRIMVEAPTEVVAAAAADRLAGALSGALG